MVAAESLEEEQLPIFEDDLQKLCQQATSGVQVMVCSVLGSFLSQEVIKAVSHTGKPAFNVFLFSSKTFAAKTIPIQ